VREPAKASRCNRDTPVMTTVTRPAPAFLSIYDDKTCVGFVIPRGRVFDRFENSLGAFASLCEVAGTIPKSIAP
jgi:hypothetical protein